MTFESASEKVKTLSSRPSNDVLLKLYALYKQGSEGDVSGSRPGLLDVKGRAKWDAWSKLKGTAKDKAKSDYVKLVQSLLDAES